MNCQRIQDRLVDYEGGSLPADVSAQIRAHLAGCPVCQREWADVQKFLRRLETLSVAPVPSPRLREQFYAMLDTHESEAGSSAPFALARGGIDRFFAALLPARPAMQFAFALVLLLGGLFVGRQFLARSSVVVAADDSAKRELAALRAEVNSMGHLVTYSLLQQQTTSDRMRTVLATMDLQNPDRRVLTDLVGTLVFDQSMNVRLSAVDALALHADDSLVRAGIQSALPRETAPLVQVAMIELLATVGDQSALPVLEKISRDDTQDRNVREAARRALVSLQLPAHALRPTSTSLNPNRQTIPL